MGIKEFLQHLSKGSIRKAFMGNRGKWNQSGRKRTLKDGETRSWLGRTKNKVGNFFFGARGKTNKERKYLGRVKNYLEAGIKKIPFLGRRVTRSRNNRQQQAAPSSGSWWWPWGRKPNKPSLTSYNIVPEGTVVHRLPAKLGKESKANLNSIAQLQIQQELERIAAGAAAAAAGAAAAKGSPKAKSLHAAATAGAAAVHSLSPNPSAQETLAGVVAGIQAAVKKNPSLKSISFTGPGLKPSQMGTRNSPKQQLLLLKNKPKSPGQGLTAPQRIAAVTAVTSLRAPTLKQAAAAGARSLPPRSSPKAFGQAAAAATLASLGSVIPERLRTLPSYVTEMLGTRKSPKKLLLLKNKPKSLAKNRRGPLRKLLSLQPQLKIIKERLRKAENAQLRKMIPYMAARKAHTGTQSARLKELIAANSGARNETPKRIETEKYVGKKIRFKKMLEKAHPTSPVGSPKSPEGGASTRKTPYNRQKHRFGKWEI